MALLKEEVLLKAWNYKIKASVCVKRVWKTLTAVLNTVAGPNLLKQICFLQAWARDAVTIKETSVRSAASTQLDARRVKRLKVQLVQRVAKTSF